MLNVTGKFNLLVAPVQTVEHGSGGVGDVCPPLSRTMDMLTFFIFQERIRDINEMRDDCEEDYLYYLVYVIDPRQSPQTGKYSKKAYTLLHKKPLNGNRVSLLTT